MKNLVCLVALLIAVSAHAENYGAAIKPGNPVTLNAAIEQLAAAPKQNVLVEGKVDKICVAKGCWLGLVSDAGDVRVTFKDYAFFVPPTLIGKSVIVEGVLEKVVMTMEETRHYVKDAGGDPSTVTAPRVEYRIVASGVQTKS